MKQIIFTFDPEDFKKEIISAVTSQLISSTSYLKAHENSELLSRKETAAYFNIALSTLWKYTKKGNLKAYYIGNKVFYKKNEIECALVNLK